MQVYGFLLNDRRVYLIGERKQQVDTYSTRHQVELRRLTLGGRRGCGRRFPVTSTDPFDFDQCSRLIALVASEMYSKNPVYQPLEGLLAVAAPDSSVDIYLQVVGPILWGHSGPLCHALSLLLSSSSSLLLWTSMRRRRATVVACDSSDTW